MIRPPGRGAPSAALALAACAAFVFCGVAGAQELSVRLGGLHARYADSVSGSAASLGPRLVVGNTNSQAVVEFSFAQFVTDGWAVQAAGEAARWFRAGSSDVVFAAGAALNRLESGAWSGQSQAHAVVGLPLGRFVASLGGSVGAVRRVSEREDAVTSVILGVHTTVNGVVLRYRSQFIEAGAEGYGDLSLAAAWRPSRLSLEADIGVRVFDGGATEGSWQVNAVLPLGPMLALEAASGTWPRSPEGFARGRFASFGLRLTRGSAPGTAPGFARLLAPPRGASRVTVMRLERQLVRITLPAPRSESVAIAFEHDAWTPHRMTRETDGRWSVELDLPPGVHKFSLVLNGTRWVVPDGVRTLPDDFGGRVGLLFVR